MEITLQKKKDNEQVYKIYVKIYFFWENVLVNLFTDRIISWKEKKMQTLLLKRQWSKQPLIMTGKRFCNYQKCPTVLSEEFKKSYSCFSQVKSYLTKPTQSLLKWAVLCKSCQGFQKLHCFSLHQNFLNPLRGLVYSIPTSIIS